MKLSILEDNYRSVSRSTNTLHELCEHLLEQQNALGDSARLIEKCLLYFFSVDMLYAELGAPSFVVSREKIEPILDKINGSLQFFKEHPKYKESAYYSQKARDTLSKALLHIKHTVMRIIKRTINELLELHDVINTENSFILLYGRFRSQGPKIRSLVCLLEERADENEQCAEALRECHKFYLQHREELLLPVVQNGLTDLLERYSADHCALFRTGSAFILHLCEDELRLFQQFFVIQFSDSVNQMLAKLCRCLYDVVRPIVIRLNHMEILSELCDILKYELLNENKPTVNRPDISAFNELCAMLLADVQERLIFRSHVYIKSQILGYTPGPGDLAYPEKLEMMDTISRAVSVSDSTTTSDDSTLNQEENISASTTMIGQASQQSLVTSSPLFVIPGSNMSLAPADLHGMWYPTVRRTLVFLSKLSRCLDANSFQGLAQECVSMCVQSLIKASDSISSNRTTLDGQLFLIKHLLILREQMAPFNVEFLVTETSLNFSNYKNVALSILERRGSSLFALNGNNVILRFLLETPDAIDVEIDSRRQLDGQLKLVCESLIEHQINYLSGELSNFLQRARAVLAVPAARMSDQSFASALILKEIISNSYRLMSVALGRVPVRNGKFEHVKCHIPNLRKSFHLYLANIDTENILLRRIQAGVLSHWREIYQLLIDQYSDEDRMIVGCPTESQIRLLFQDA